ncbi:hypothetical protein MFM001_13340 [Mycobacterium sp. MFM001]|uniref:hypothetical protein n=1 Tax=Mycobacterium sp. MFM001 TaxID=2049453 RepID=UPI000DA4A47E|nr:hypothetical protein [Mycobacterium sp. MFM001]GBE64872.1 hypothetical protein MFM001_13340 [Mycobacterium sp. MFM001]
MDAQDEEQTGGEDRGANQQQSEAPEVTDEHKEKAAEMRKSYDDQRPTAVMPGTDRTITGTAVNEWLDDEGNPKFGDPDEKPHADDNPPETQEPPD